MEDSLGSSRWRRALAAVLALGVAVVAVGVSAEQAKAAVPGLETEVTCEGLGPEWELRITNTRDTRLDYTVTFTFADGTTEEPFSDSLVAGGATEFVVDPVREDGQYAFVVDGDTEVVGIDCVPNEIPGVTLNVTCPGESDQFDEIAGVSSIRFSVTTDSETMVPDLSMYDVVNGDGTFTIRGGEVGVLPSSTELVAAAQSDAAKARVEDGTFVLRSDIDGDGTISAAEVEEVPIDCVPEGIPGITLELACQTEADPVQTLTLTTDSSTSIRPTEGSVEGIAEDGTLLFKGDFTEVRASHTQTIITASAEEAAIIEDGKYVVVVRGVREDVPVDCIADGPTPTAPSTTTTTQPPTTTTRPVSRDNPQARPVTLACPPGVVSDASFIDVPAGSTHEPAIECVSWYHVALGYPDRSFRPANAVTRGQLATFVGNVLTAGGIPAPANPPDAFPDDNGDTHEARINWLAQAGVLSGFPDGSFRPGAPVTRGQLATYLTRAHQAITGQELPLGSVTFPDDAGTHQANIRRVAAAGITAGYADGQFKPGQPTRRDQMASFLARTVDLLVDTNHISRPG